MQLMDEESGSFVTRHLCGRHKSTRQWAGSIRGLMLGEHLYTATQWTNHHITGGCATEGPGSDDAR